MACHGAGSNSIATYGSNVNHIQSGDSLGDGVVTLANDMTSFNNTDDTCLNACHNVVNTRDWAMTLTASLDLNCDDCHTATTKSLYRNRLAGSHPSHYGTMATTYGDATNNSSGTTYDFGCGQCHPTTAIDHLDNSVREVQAAIDYSGGATGTCTNNSCHQDGKGNDALITPTWGTAFSGDSCAQCHGNSPLTAAHEVHSVGIHATAVDAADTNAFTDIYNGLVGLFKTGGTAPSGHGDTNSTTINCNLCHNDTVTMQRNLLGSECNNCHSGDTAGTDTMIVSDTAAHLDFDADIEVVFENTNVKSKAQLRDDLSAVASLNSTWTRTDGYKAASTSHDVAQSSLTTTVWDGTTCSNIACHNSQSADWAAPANDCMACHTSVPK